MGCGIARFLPDAFESFLSKDSQLGIGPLLHPIRSSKIIGLDPPRCGIKHGMKCGATFTSYSIFQRIGILQHISMCNLLLKHVLYENVTACYVVL